jgi:glucokinase
MPRRILPLLERPSFIERFRRKDRMEDLVARVPLHVIVARGVALNGAAEVALRGNSGAADATTTSLQSRSGRSL